MFKCFVPRCIIDHFYFCEIIRDFSSYMLMFIVWFIIYLFFQGVFCVAHWQLFFVGVVAYIILPSYLVRLNNGNWPFY